MPLDLGQSSLVSSITNNQILSFNKTVAVISLIVFSCAINQAQASPSYKTLYKSIGEFGEVKYSQFEPDAGSKFEVIFMRADGIQSQPGLLAADIVNQRTGRQNYTDQQPTINPATDTASSSEADAQSKCQKLRNNLTSLNAGGEIYESQPNGERRFLNPIEVALKLEDTQKLLVQYCKAN